MQMILRPATPEDEELLYCWRKQDESDGWWQGDSVTPEEHHDWLRDRLASPAVQIWIAENEGEPIGQARIDSNGEISFSIDVDHRWAGHGSDLVRQATENALLKGHRRVKANVDRTNWSAYKALLNSGYVYGYDVLFMRWKPR